MFCGKCGKQIRDDSKFCEFCGTPVMPVPQKTGGTPPPAALLNGAGQIPQIPADKPMANHGNNAETNQTKTNKTKTNKKKTVGILCVVGLAAALAAGGFLVKDIWFPSEDTAPSAELLAAAQDFEQERSETEDGTVEWDEVSESAMKEDEAVSEEITADTDTESVVLEAEEETADLNETDSEETAVLEAADSEAVLVENEADSSGEYILPECDTRLYTIEELSSLSLEELRLARNEIYARHGRQFQTEDLNQYFSEKSWYEPRYSAAEMDALGDSYLNAFETENRNRIVQAESAVKGERPMQVINCQESITLRTAPSTTAAQICQIPLGATVTYKGASEGLFYKIEYEGVVGYAIGSYFAEVS